ncbi:unnamed protein product [Ceratitis capitata]|uniref:(Mediterranean fruit fly) hypothetical protein n=1 Tax=Ceratitis capitata TaxID=7213 RepID=A0A811U6M3_CERCA|nr:unnamed protein product [Ceratitis capitata]
MTIKTADDDTFDNKDSKQTNKQTNNQIEQQRFLQQAHVWQTDSTCGCITSSSFFFTNHYDDVFGRIG